MKLPSGKNKAGSGLQIKRADAPRGPVSPATLTPHKPRGRRLIGVSRGITILEKALCCCWKSEPYFAQTDQDAQHHKDIQMAGPCEPQGTADRRIPIKTPAARIIDCDAGRGLGDGRSKAKHSGGLTPLFLCIRAMR